MVQLQLDGGVLLTTVDTKLESSHGDGSCLSLPQHREESGIHLGAILVESSLDGSNLVLAHAGLRGL